MQISLSVPISWESLLLLFLAATVFWAGIVFGTWLMNTTISILVRFFQKRS